MLRSVAVALVLALVTVAAATADVQPGLTVFSPADGVTYGGPSATVPLDYHADCTSDGTKYVVASAFNDAAKQVQSTGTLFKLDGPVSMTLTIDNDSFLEVFTIKFFLNCGKDYLPTGERTVMLMDGKLQARRAQQDWQEDVGGIEERMKGLGCAQPSPETKYACGAYAFTLIVADRQVSYYRQIADDPPDPHFRAVAAPKALRTPHFTGAGAAAVNRLDIVLATAEANLGALVTSIDRAGAARKAGVAAAFRMQRAAAIRFARRAAAALRSLPALARTALDTGRRGGAAPARQVALHGPLSALTSATFNATIEDSGTVLDAIAGR